MLYLDKNGDTHMCPGSLQSNRDVAKELKKRGFHPKGHGIDWRTGKMFKTIEKWTSIWERFAGKPYVKPAGKPKETIKETVRLAQKLMYGIWMHDFCEQLRCARDYFDKLYDGKTVVQDVQYPKSLGELCLEEYENSLRWSAMDWPEIKWKKSPNVDKLRQLMWHKDRGCYSVDKVGKVWVTWESGEYVRSREKGYELI